MAANGFANGQLHGNHISSDEEEIDLRDNKYADREEDAAATMTTSQQEQLHVQAKRNRAYSDTDRDSIEESYEAIASDDGLLSEQRLHKSCRRPHEEDMDVDDEDEDDVELEIACLREDETESEGEEDKDMGDEKGGTVSDAIYRGSSSGLSAEGDDDYGDDDLAPEVGMTSANGAVVGDGGEQGDGERHAGNTTTTSTAVAGRHSVDSSGGAGVCGSGTDASGEPSALLQPPATTTTTTTTQPHHQPDPLSQPHAACTSGSSASAAHAAVSVAAEQPTGGEESERDRRSSTGEDCDSRSSVSHRRSYQQQEDEQQQTGSAFIAAHQEQQQSVIFTRSTSSDRVPSFHYNQDVGVVTGAQEEEDQRPTTSPPADSADHLVQEEETAESLIDNTIACGSPVSGPSPPPASPITATFSEQQTTTESQEDGPHSPPPPGSDDNTYSTLLAAHTQEGQPLRDDQHHGGAAANSTGLSHGFLDYLGKRMERSMNSPTEEEAREVLEETPALAAAAEQQNGIADHEVDILAAKANPEAEGSDDEKDVDTAVVSGSASQPEVVENGDDDGAAAGESEDKVEERAEEAGSESLEQTDNTADNGDDTPPCAEVDAADKDVTDEKEQKSDDEEEEKVDELVEPSQHVATADLVSFGSGDAAIDERETEGEIAICPPDTSADDDAGSGQEEEQAQEEQQQAAEPEVARPESPPAEPEVPPCSVDSSDLPTQPQEEADDDNVQEEIPPSPTQEEEEQQEEEKEIIPPQSTAALDDEAVESHDDQPTGAAEDVQEEVKDQEEQDSDVVQGATAAAIPDTEVTENASDEEQPTFIEHPSPTTDEAPQVQEEPQTVEEEAAAASPEQSSAAAGSRTPPGDITRADDKFDDGIESVQSISNIKTRFQTKDEKPPMPGEGYRSSVSPSNGHVNGDRTPPEVVNRSDSQEDILGRELPPVNMARTMASKFRDLESTDMSPTSDRKPVRKMTPPRDELERSVSGYEREVERRADVVRGEDPVEKEDERPPPSFTKNMLARFKEMEDTTKAPPSPGRSAVSPTKRTHRPIATQSYIKSSPDEGIADTEPVNGHGNNKTAAGDVIREADKNEQEELPERGITKSLVGRWREIEQSAGPSKSPLAPRQPGSTPSAVRNATTYRHTSPATDATDRGEVIRETDNFEEENLPPPSYTKNMLAKFQSLQQEAQKDPATTPTKKQFKWTVKETKPLGAAGASELQSQSVNGHDGDSQHNGDNNNRYGEDEEVFSSEDEYEDYYDEADITLECDEQGNPLYPINHPKHPDNVRRRKEARRQRKAAAAGGRIVSETTTTAEEDLPAPETTKKLLSQFKSMEDVSAAPPTPETSTIRQRASRSSISLTPMRGQSTSSSIGSREQPDGIENTELATNGDVSNLDSASPEVEVVREGEGDNMAAELPEQGTTRNLLARFQSLQAV